MKKDKSVLSLGNLVFSQLLSTTKNKRFFTQSEYEDNLTTIMKIDRLECEIQQKINK